MEAIIIRNYNKSKFRIKRTGEFLCDCYIANNFFKRFKGLMFSNEGVLKNNEALFLTKTNSIHMFFMNFEIDVIFLDKDNKILDIIYSMKKRRVSKIYSKAKNVLEFKAKALEGIDIKIGDILENYE